MLDDKGFVRAGTDIHKPLETNLPGVYAIGDVRSGSVKRVAAAVGEAFRLRRRRRLSHKFGGLDGWSWPNEKNRGRPQPPVTSIIGARSQGTRCAQRRSLR